MWYVYLLDCADGDIYKGSAKNVTDRIEEHKKGRVEATKHKLPVELICFIAFSNNDVAFRFENIWSQVLELAASLVALISKDH